MQAADAVAPELAVWAFGHPNELACWFGHNPCRGLVSAGREGPAR